MKKFNVPGFRGWYTYDALWEKHPTVPLWPRWWNIRGMIQLHKFF